MLKSRFRYVLLFVALVMLVLLNSARTMKFDFATGHEEREMASDWAFRIRRHCSALTMTGVKHRDASFKDWWLQPTDTIDRKLCGRGHWPDVIYYVIMCAEHLRYLDESPKLPQKPCDSFRDYGYVSKCERHAVHIYPSALIHDVAETVFWSMLYQYDLKPKSTMARFADCVSHWSNKYSAFCEELAESLYVTSVPSAMRRTVVGFNPKSFFRDSKGMGKGPPPQRDGSRMASVVWD